MAELRAAFPSRRALCEPTRSTARWPASWRAAATECERRWRRRYPGRNRAEVRPLPRLWTIPRGCGPPGRSRARRMRIGAAAAPGQSRAVRSATEGDVWIDDPLGCGWSSRAISSCRAGAVHGHRLPGRLAPRARCRSPRPASLSLIPGHGALMDRAEPSSPGAPHSTRSSIAGSPTGQRPTASPAGGASGRVHPGRPRGGGRQPRRLLVDSRLRSRAGGDDAGDAATARRQELA